MSKRSKNLNLVLMASASAAVLTACSEAEVDGKAYKSVDACISDAYFSEQTCMEGWQEATETNLNTAPRYNDPRLCEEQHGWSNCEQRVNSSGSFWSPFMAGYFVANVVDDALDAYRYRGLYRARKGGYYTAGGYHLNNRGSGRFGLDKKSLSKAPKAAKVQTRTTVAARGGFGKSFGSRSFGG